VALEHEIREKLDFPSGQRDLSLAISAGVPNGIKRQAVNAELTVLEELGSP